MKKLLIAINYTIALVVCGGLIARCTHSSTSANRLNSELLKKEAEMLRTMEEGKKKNDFIARQRVLNPLMKTTISLFPVQYGSYCVGVVIVAVINHLAIRGRRRGGKQSDPGRNPRPGGRNLG